MRRMQGMTRPRRASRLISHRVTLHQELSVALFQAFMIKWFKIIFWKDTIIIIHIHNSKKKDKTVKYLTANRTSVSNSKSRQPMWKDEKEGKRDARAGHETHHSRPSQMPRAQACCHESYPQTPLPLKAQSVWSKSHVLMYKHGGLTPEPNELLMSYLQGWHQGFSSSVFFVHWDESFMLNCKIISWFCD